MKDDNNIRQRSKIPETGYKMLRNLLKTMRPEQWYKNLLVFVGIVFSLNLFNIDLWANVIFAFIFFCMLSGSAYIINDIFDAEADRRHPRKRKRPIASGDLKATHALSASLMLILLSLFGAYLINLSFLCVSVLFLLSTLSYSIWLKHIIIVDALVIGVDFVLRAIAGCFAIGVPLSPWIILCALLLALVIAFGKRREEIASLGVDSKEHRKALEGYSIEMLDQLIEISASAVIVSYSLFTFFSETLWMMTTIPVVIYGIFRYIFLVHSENVGADMKIIFKDNGMIICIAIWMVLCIVILYDIPEMIL